MLQVNARVAVWIALLAACLFGSARTFAWPSGWLVLGVYVAIVVYAVATLDHDLMLERVRPGPGVKPADVAIASLGALLLYPATCVVAGLDFAAGWSPALPPAALFAALAFFAAGYALALWAMRANRFFSTFVRIQQDRGHHVVDVGPYAWVRHPGYSGVLAAHLAMPVALGSLWALAPAVLGCVVFVARTTVEDATLARELPGYADYRQRVRWRLAPGVW